MKKSSINTFLKLIQISLGGEFHDFPSLDTAEWQELFILAHKQAIVGILSNIVETLPADKRPPREILLKVGSINSIFYFLHKAAEPFNCLEQDNLA